VVASPPRPPGPPPTPRNPVRLYRFFRAFSQDPIGFVGARFERYGDLYFTVSNGDPLFVTRDPDVVYDIMVKKAGAFRKRSEDLAPVLGQGLLNSDGELWRRQRRMVQPAFARPRLEAYAEVFRRRVDAALERWAGREVIDLGAEMMRLTLEIVVETLFAHDVEGDVEAVARSVDAVQEGMTSLWPRWAPVPVRWRERRGLRVIEATLRRMVRARRASPGEDLLSQLVMARDEGQGMSEALLRDEIVTLFVAGHETTSLALTWTFYLLAAHPEARERLEAEVDGLSGEPLDLGGLERLAFTGRCLDEAMRLYPPAYALPRRVAEPVELGGFPLAPGDEVLMWIYHLHRHPRWFEAPETFDPDRFAPGSERVRHPRAFIPFGAGSRTCIGRHFARFEALILLARVARRYRLHRAGGEEIRPKPRITLGPSAPVRMRLEARSA
jgi:cytochrome P450